MDEREEEQIRQEFEAARQRQRAAQQQAQQNQGPQMFEQNDFSDIRHVIGVVSGKGGVGKSYVCASIAIELARRGFSVGILDADITGPSIPKMLGLSHERATALQDMLVPATSLGGIKVMSANLVLENETDPVVWRGPVIAGVLQQFWGQTAWGEIDYLLVDMPPGTSDVALTVFQSLPVEGIVIVSSPQDLVQMVVGKAVNMASLMQIPVLGIVENMSYIECPDCGRKIEPFGPSRLAETAELYGINVLGRLPIDPSAAAMCDAGTIERDLPKDMLSDAVDLIQNVTGNGKA